MMFNGLEPYLMRITDYTFIRCGGDTAEAESEGMDMKKSTIIMAIGGILVFVSLFLPWGQIQLFGGAKVYDAWALKTLFNDLDGILNLIASFSVWVLLIFSICTTIEAIVEDKKPGAIGSGAGAAFIFNGIVIIVMTFIPIFAMKDIAYMSVRVGAFLSLLGGLLITAGAVLNYKKLM